VQNTTYTTQCAHSWQLLSHIDSCCHTVVTHWQLLSHTVVTHCQLLSHMSSAPHSALCLRYKFNAGDMGLNFPMLNGCQTIANCQGCEQPFKSHTLSSQVTFWFTFVCFNVILNAWNCFVQEPFMDCLVSFMERLNFSDTTVAAASIAFPRIASVFGPSATGLLQTEHSPPASPRWQWGFNSLSTGQVSCYYSLICSSLWCNFPTVFEHALTRNKLVIIFLFPCSRPRRCKRITCHLLRRARDGVLTRCQPAR
jgi:hypothetical protein